MAKLKKSSLLSTEALQKLFPRKKSEITQEELDVITQSMDDVEFNGYGLVESMIDNQDVMQMFRCSFMEYINAVKFCAFTMGGNQTSVYAYIRTFGNRDFVKERMNIDKKSSKYIELASAASRYSKSPIVQEIARRESTSIYLTYRNEVHNAVMVLADEMVNAPLSKDRSFAADKLLVHVKPPETLKIEANVNTNGVDIQTSLMSQLESLAIRQKKMFEDGMTISEVQRLGIKTEVIDVEIEDE